ncbi:hypothetical protein EWM64_g8626, partial [Hericium alpestre]
FLANREPDTFGGDHPSIRVERTQWLPNIGFRVSFSERPPESLDDILHTYLARYTDEDSNHLRVSRFQFRNTVFFRRVPLCAPNGDPSTVNGLLNELLADPLWRNIQIAGPPRLHVPEHTQGYGVLYVDFVDNARSSVLRNALKQSKRTNLVHRTDLLSHPHLICFSLTVRGLSHLFLNVYADPTNHAVLEYLYNRPSLPSFALVCGDFNLHHQLWDDAYGFREAAQRLIDLMPDMSVSLLNTPNIYTHFPHNTALCPTVIDLVWVNDTMIPSPSTTLIVDADGREAFDHAKMLITLPLSPEFDPQLHIKRKSDEEDSFLVDACGAFSPVEDVPLDDHDSIQVLCNTIFNSLQRAFLQRTTKPKITAHSKRWWNDECRDALRAYREDKSQDNRWAYFRTVRRVQREHFEGVIQEVTANKCVWDLTSWTCPRLLPTTSIIKDRDGTPLTTLQELATGFQQQFFSAADRPIDYSVLDDLERLPTRAFDPISLAELEEQVTLCSARSPRGQITSPGRSSKSSSKIPSPALRYSRSSMHASD